jgi:hypothetical protein
MKSLVSNQEKGGGGEKEEDMLVVPLSNTLFLHLSIVVVGSAKDARMQRTSRPGISCSTQF